MLRIFNTLGKKMEVFRPVDRKRADIFTCGPSVYQRSHIGNFRTFLFEDILVRYLRYSGLSVKRGMNFTDIEDKALEEAHKRQASVQELTEGNIKKFDQEMKILKMSALEYAPRASQAVDKAVEIILDLLKRGIAYWYHGNVYFDPTKYPGFGQLSGLDMSRWPRQKRRFHRDTYPGMRWNLGDFVLWHGYKEGEPYWDTKLGRGRPSWNIQDPSMILKVYHGTLSIYCGGIDNLVRHHDYTRAILESVRPYPMAKYWLHCRHLVVEGHKMSKSRGNIYYVEDLLADGYTRNEIRFFLLYGHYRQELDYTSRNMQSAANKLKALKKTVGAIARRAKASSRSDPAAREEIVAAFQDRMDDDLHVDQAFDSLEHILRETLGRTLSPKTASGILKGIEKIDEVTKVFF
jgi:cysteinyl-tRNA synthetase